MKFEKLAKQILNEGRAKFGASFNCIVGNEEFGGGAEGVNTVDFVHDNPFELIRNVENSAMTEHEEVKTLRDHPLIGQKVPVGGKVVAVFVYKNNNEPCGVMFTDPDPKLSEDAQKRLEDEEIFQMKKDFKTMEDVIAKSKAQK